MVSVPVLVALVDNVSPGTVPDTALIVVLNVVLPMVCPATGVEPLFKIAIVLDPAALKIVAVERPMMLTLAVVKLVEAVKFPHTATLEVHD